MSHIPVMLPEVLSALSLQDGETYVDGTFGAGGYSREILAAANCNLIALDRDENVQPTAKKFSAEFGPRFSFRQTEFSKLDEVLGGPVDGIVLDIGVSSMQLDQAGRGFSFMRSGPLDMRMGQNGVTAADAINLLSFNELVRIFKVYGEERRAQRCADFILRAREESRIDTTGALADIISKALGRSGKTHPATRVFQALRIYINDELGELYRALLAAEKMLKPGGRLVVVTFHSLEDRIVKSFLKARSQTQQAGSRHLPPQAVSGDLPSFKAKGGVSPSKAEQAENPRSRSSRLRLGVRTNAPIWPHAGNEALLPDALDLNVLTKLAAKQEKTA